MPYDALGQYIPGDDEDERRGALAAVSLSDTVRRMLSSPANDLSPLRKAQTYKDIAGGFASAGESALRGVGSAVLGMTGDMLEHARTTPLIPGVTDKMTLGTVLPGADTLFPTSKYQYEPRRAPNTSYPAPRENRQILGVPYVTSADLREAFPQRYTEPFGDATANAFMEELGVFMAPSVIHSGKKLIEEGLTLASKMPGMTQDAAQAFAMDYANAMRGIYPAEPTAGSRAADIAKGAKNVNTAVNKAILRPSDVAIQKMTGNPNATSMQVIDEAFAPVSSIIRKPGGQFVRSDVKPSELESYGDFPSGSNFERMIADYYIRNPRDPHETTSQWNDLLNLSTTFDSPELRNAPVRPKDLSDEWNKFITDKALERYPDAPSPMSARKALTAFEQRKGTWGNTKLALADEFVQTNPEVQLWNSLVPDHKKIVSPYELQERNVAANQYIENQIAKYVQSQLGSEKDPMLRAAAQGLTHIPREDLAQSFETRADGSIDFQRSSVFNDAQLRRRYQGFDEQGVMYPQLVEVRNELAQIGNEINVKNLQLQDLLPEVLDRDPVTIPGYLPLRTELEQLGRRKSQLEEKAYALETGTMYETLADLSLETSTAGAKLEDIDYANRQFFPYLQKLPSTEKVYDITSRYTPLGLADLTSSVLEDVRAGSIPLDQIKNVSLEKYVRGKAETRVAKEKAEAKLAALDRQALMSYAQQRLAEDLQMGWAKPYGNAVVLTIDDVMPPELVRRQLSLDTEILDHCAGQGGRSERKGRQYEPMVMPHTNVVPKNSHGGDTDYVRRIADKDLVVASVRDAQTGLTTATIELKLAAKDTPDEPTQYNLGYVSGYHNRTIDPMYQDAIKHYLNENAKIIRRASDYLEDNIAIYDTINASQRRNLLSDAGVGDTEFRTATLQYGDAMPRFMTVDDVRKLMAETQLTPVHEGSLALKLKNTVADLEVARFQPDDDAVDSLQGRLEDLTQRIERLPDAELTREAVILLDDMFEGAPPGTTIAEKIDMLRADSPADVGIPERLYNRMVVLLQDAQEGRPIPTLNQLTPALPATTVGNVVQNLINQYPDPIQVQALINDLERGAYDELPVAIRNADEIVRDATVSQIIDQLTEYRDAVPGEWVPEPPVQLPAAAPDAQQNSRTLLFARNNAFAPLDDALRQDAANVVDHAILLHGANDLLGIRQTIAESATQIYNGARFRHLDTVDRLHLVNALNNFANEIAPAPVAPVAPAALPPAQITDIINREVARQHQIVNLSPDNLRRLDEDMTSVTREPNADQMIAMLENIHESYRIMEADGLERTVSAMLNEILRTFRNNVPRAPVQLPAAAPAVRQERFAEFNGDMNQTQARNRIEQILNDNTINDADIRELRNIVNDPDHLQFRNEDAEFIGELNDMIDYRLNEGVPRPAPARRGFAQGGPVQRYAKGGIVKRKIHVAKDLATMKAELMKGR